MWVEEASKSEGRAVGHVTRTELVADWAFSWIKADQLAFLLSKTKVGRIGRALASERRMKLVAGFSFYTLFDMIGPATFLPPIGYISGRDPPKNDLSCGGTEGTDSANVPRLLY